MVHRDAPVLPAAAVATAATVVLVLLIYVGSRRLKDFDAALIGYAVGSVFAIGALVYRYARWLARPPTWRYFRAGWASFLSWRNFRRYTLLVPRALWRDLIAQTFILQRGPLRWVMHQSLFWGVLLSCLITFPLTFGWIRFTLVPPAEYQLWFFGLPLFVFPVEARTGFALFHALDWTALLLVVGVGIALWRRVRDVGLLSVQRFGFDLLPLVLLLAIAATGLALSASSLWWEGRYYSFISLTHQVVVVAWLLSLPYGKFFHIVQRPASVGVTLYQAVTHGLEQARGGALDGPRAGLVSAGRPGQLIAAPVRAQWLRDQGAPGYPPSPAARRGVVRRGPPPWRGARPGGPGCAPHLDRSAGRTAPPRR